MCIVIQKLVNCTLYLLYQVDKGYYPFKNQCPNNTRRAGGGGGGGGGGRGSVFTVGF